MVTILMMSAKMATPGLCKIKVFWKKDYDVIISVNDVTKVLGANSDVCRSYRGTTGRGSFCTPPPPLSWIGSKLFFCKIMIFTCNVIVTTTCFNVWLVPTITRGLIPASKIVINIPAILVLSKIISNQKSQSNSFL